MLASNDVDLVIAIVNSVGLQIKSMPISVHESRYILWKINLTISRIVAGTTILAAVDETIVGNTTIPEAWSQGQQVITQLM